MKGAKFMPKNLVFGQAGGGLRSKIHIEKKKYEFPTKDHVRKHWFLREIRILSSESTCWTRAACGAVSIKPPGSAGTAREPSSPCRTRRRSMTPSPPRRKPKNRKRRKRASNPRRNASLFVYLWHNYTLSMEPWAPASPPTP